MRPVVSWPHARDTHTTVGLNKSGEIVVGALAGRETTQRLVTQRGLPVLAFLISVRSTERTYSKRPKNREGEAPAEPRVDVMNPAQQELRPPKSQF